MAKLVGRTLNGPEDFPRFIDQARGFLGHGSYPYGARYNGLHAFANRAIDSGRTGPTEGIILPSEDIILRHGEDIYPTEGGHAKMITDVGYGDFGARMIELSGSSGVYRLGDPAMAESAFPAGGLRQNLFGPERGSVGTNELSRAVFNMQNYGMPYEDVRSLVVDAGAGRRNYDDVMADVADTMNWEFSSPQVSFYDLEKTRPEIRRGPSVVFGYERPSGGAKHLRAVAVRDGMQITNDYRHLFPSSLWGDSYIFNAIHDPQTF